MGFLSGRSARADVTWTPWDQRWYMPLGLESDAGISVSPQTVLNCGAVLAAVRFKSESFGLCPAKVYVEKQIDGRTVNEEDRAHYLFKLLRRPNKAQTGFQWRQHQAFNVILHGNSYSRIVPGERTFAGELQPLPPERMRVLKPASDGSMLYEYQHEGGRRENLSQSEVLHFRGLSQDGLSGLVTYQLIRNIVGIALSAEKHAGKFLKKGARIGGVLTSKGTLSKESAKVAEDSLSVAWGGPDAEGKIVFVPSELDFKAVTLDHQKAQFLELRDHQVEEILRALGVPGVVVGYSKNLMGYASADAFFEKGGIKHCLLPMIQNFEDEIDYDLILESDAHYCKFSLATLLRASTKEMYETLLKAAGRPLLTGNEARRILDFNPDSDPSMDKVMMPVNMATGAPAEDEPEPADDAPPAAPPGARPMPALPADDEEQARRARLEQHAVNAAARVIRREISAVKGTGKTIGAGQRYKDKPAAWAAWVREFYGGHVSVVERELLVSAEAAGAYVERQVAALIAGGAGVVETWEATRYPVLEAMALGEPWEELLNEETAA